MGTDGETLVINKGTALAVAAFRRLREDTHVAQEGEEAMGRGWKILRDHWEDFVQKRDTIANRVAKEVAKLNSPPGPVRPGMRKEKFDRALDRLSNPVGDETPRTLSRMQRWAKAKHQHTELRGHLAHLGWNGPKPGRTSIRGPDDSLASGAELPTTAAGAAEAFFPARWREALTPELLADLIVDAMLPAFADGFLDELAAVVEEERKPPAPPPPPRKLGGSRSTPGGFADLEKRRAVMPLPRLDDRSPPDELSPGERVRLLSPINDHLRMPSKGFATLNLPQRGAGRHDPWASHPYFASANNMRGAREQIIHNTATQRPRQRLRRRLETVADTKFVSPMAATHFPQEWEKTTGKRLGSKDNLGSPRAAADKGRQRSSADAFAGVAPATQIVETEEMNPTWLIKSDATGRSIFPYSLAAHRAFIDSQSEEWLREKAREVAPMTYTRWN